MRFRTVVLSSRHAETAASPRGGAQGWTAYLAPRPSTRQEGARAARPPPNRTMRRNQTAKIEVWSAPRTAERRDGDTPPLRRSKTPDRDSGVRRPGIQTIEPAAGDPPRLHQLVHQRLRTTMDNVGRELEDEAVQGQFANRGGVLLVTTDHMASLRIATDY